MIGAMSHDLQFVNSQSLMRDAIGSIAVGPDRGRDISHSQAEQLCKAILAGEIDEVQIGIFLIALRMKRESPQEFAGLFAGLHDQLEITEVSVDQLVCLADPFDGYLRNLSTTAFIPAVLAACGLPAVIHGVRQVGPKNGITAHQVYQLAGIDTAVSADTAAQQIRDVGWSYIDQSVYAPSLYGLQSLRERIVKRTAFTTLERVLVPLRAQGHTHLVLGFVHKAYPEIYAALANQGGFASALLVKGIEGGLAPALNKPLRSWYFDFNHKGGDQYEKQQIDLPASLSANSVTIKSTNISAERSLQIGLQVLTGKQGTARNCLVVAVANILQYYSQANSFATAVEKVQNSLDNGSAQACFDQLVQSA